LDEQCFPVVLKLKTVAGVQVAWVGGEAMNIQLNGVPADYTPVTVNGFEQASAQANTARNIQMTNVATNNLSRIEVRFSPTPDSPGSALAGTVNLVVRSAFDRARPALNVSSYLLMRDGDRSLARTLGPGRGTSPKVQPGFEFSYVKPVSERFGFTLSGGGTTQYQPSTFIQTTWRGAAAATGVNAVSGWSRKGAGVGNGRQHGRTCSQRIRLQPESAQGLLGEPH
jgi:iron complex outermembrane receptor protein